jgi:hypothetical protein
MGDFINGTRLVVNGYAVVITNHRQVLVGEVSAADILNAAPNTVVVTGQVLVRKATTYAPILRPNRATAIVMFVKTVNILCDLTNVAGNFILTVALNECHTSPVLQDAVFPAPYFLIDKNNISFYTKNLCLPSSLNTQIQLKSVACSVGWSAIFTGPAS